MYLFTLHCLLIKLSRVVCQKALYLDAASDYIDFAKINMFLYFDLVSVQNKYCVSISFQKCDDCVKAKGVFPF